MVRVKKIALIISMSVFWVITQQFACIKHNGNPVMATTVTPGLPGLPTDSLSYLALGDSYTIGQSVEAGDRYPAQVVMKLRSDMLLYKNPDIIAVTGWTTGDLLAATPATALKPAYNIVSLLIGVNNQYQHLSQSQYRSQFTVLLERSIALAGDRPTHVLVLSIPDYSVTPFASNSDRAVYIAAQIDSFNAINREITQAYQAQYLDVTGESRKAANDPSLIASDGLHFSGKEYEIWAALMEPLMKKMR
jgi:lysophospholipase L1-like esterase